MGRLAHFTPSRSKKTSKNTGKFRSSLSEDTFRRVFSSDQKRGHGNAIDNSPLTKSSRKKKNDVISFIALKNSLHESRPTSPSDKFSDTASESDGEDEDWLSSSNMLARYDDSDSATEEERTVALLEELQVSFQGNAAQIKRDVCNTIMTTLNDIRQTHVSIDHGPDVDRGKGIVIFNTACEKRHTDAQRLQAELQDDLAEKQAEMKRVFGQLKQCYATRQQLWEEFEAKVLRITNRQAEIVGKCEREMAEAMENFDKKYGPLLKGDTLKSKEKLLREILDKL